MAKGRALQTEKPVSSENSAGSILAMDYGRARIGLAISDAEARLPRPLDTLLRINRNEDMRRLRQIVREHRVRQIVVGLPLRLDGTRGEMSQEAARFATRVRKQLGVPVEMVDERLTSWQAERLLEEQSGRVLRSNKTAHKHAPRSKAISVDSMAAVVILQDYLGLPKVTIPPSEDI